MSFRRFGGVVFDCDGVLLDSNRIKAGIFRDILAGHPGDAVAAFTAYQQAHPGLHRRDLFAYFFTEIAPQVDFRDQTDRCVSEFSRRTLDALGGCAAVPGALELVARLHNEGVPCVVVSAAEAADLAVLLGGRGIAHRLGAIRGGDRKKADHVLDLLAAGVIARPLLYFGDSRADLDAAEAVQARFVMVSGASDWADGAEICRRRGHDVVPDLRDVERALFAVDL
ncbi:hypothetical protein SLNSH_10570 [Alsobacter soli]|uniref:phosphoglycolate phosphatase n=2 Tax=Alsobacter soli TaxID=2109933 RepID=A0A2T1HTD2_9HYPH|nr:hypothetical protein SLNSH_10570 [Alsobacter soli]